MECVSAELGSFRMTTPCILTFSLNPGTPTPRGTNRGSRDEQAILAGKQKSLGQFPQATLPSMKTNRTDPENVTKWPLTVRELVSSVSLRRGVQLKPGPQDLSLRAQQKADTLL